MKSDSHYKRNISTFMFTYFLSIALNISYGLISYAQCIFFINDDRCEYKAQHVGVEYLFGFYSYAETFKYNNNDEIIRDYATLSLEN